MSERFEHRDRRAYEYSLERELARRRARGCARVVYWLVGVVLVLGCLVGLAVIGAVA
jgi:hypothetical protein